LIEKTQTFAGYTCRSFVNDVPGLPIVFLHGLSYNVEIWQKLGITDLLTQKKIPYLMLDMPYGLRSQCTPKTRNTQKNLAVIKEGVADSFGNMQPVVVGASIGGNMALNYAAEFPVKGLLLLSPARALTGNLPKAYPNFKFPVRIIWGTEDNIVSSQEMHTLTKEIPKAKLVAYNGAGHSAYKDQPERFKMDLLELYIAAEQA
jgi:pimeloyl-ACP methyl ester carboxylesterase